MLSEPKKLKTSPVRTTFVKIPTNMKDDKNPEWTFCIVFKNDTDTT